MDQDYTLWNIRNKTVNETKADKKFKLGGIFMSLIDKDWYYRELDKFVASYSKRIDFSQYIQMNCGIGEDMAKHMDKKIREINLSIRPDQVAQFRTEIKHLFSQYVNDKKGM